MNRPQTISEKILAAHSGQETVEPGEFITAIPDLVMGNDYSSPLAIGEFNKMKFKHVFRRDKIVLVMDHGVPAKDITMAEQIKICRSFSKEQGLIHFYEAGKAGITHSFLPDAGFVGPGHLVLGGDSHNCTYGALGVFAAGLGATDMAYAMGKGELWLQVPETIRFNLHGHIANKWVSGKDLILYIIGQVGIDGALYKVMEFGGEAIRGLSIDSRMTLCNMAIEAGAKSGIIEPDSKTLDFIKGRCQFPTTNYYSDSDAGYSATYDFDASRIPLVVAAPHDPANVKPVKDLDNIPIDQVVIGSCTSGRMEDLRIAASILRGKKIANCLRLIIIPATQGIYLQASKEGLLEIFIESGAAVSTPTCGPCAGLHMGVIASGERALATTNRNFIGRMGSNSSQVYLSGAAVAAASAIKGSICLPEEVEAA